MSLYDLLDQSGDKDLSNIRTYDLGNNKIRMIREDPYGFIRVSYEKGQVPESLRGSYTSFDEARKAVDLYIKDSGKEPKSASK